MMQFLIGNGVQKFPRQDLGEKECMPFTPLALRASFFLDKTIAQPHPQAIIRGTGEGKCVVGRRKQRDRSQTD